MLLELKVKNLAILESVEIQFCRGLNILTGETGAGKSILLEALNLLLGGRSDRGLVRTGQREAWVEGLFEMDEALQQQLREWGIDAELDEPLALRRVVQNNGRSRAYINCVTVPASHLRQLSATLVDFGRQHDQAILLNPEQHLQLLDVFASATEEREAVAKAHAHVIQLQKEKKQLFESRHHRADRIEFLRYQREAILDVNPQPGEENALSDEIRALSSREKRKELALRAERMLYSDENAVQEHLALAIGPVEQLVQLDPKLNDLLDELQGALMVVEDSARALLAYQRSLNLDDQHLESLQERLDEIIKLQEKFGGNFDAVQARLHEIEAEIKELEYKKKREKELSKLIEKAKDELLRAAVPLTEKRLKSAQILSSLVEHELAELAMPQAKLMVRFRAIGTHEGVACACDDDDPALDILCSFASEDALQTDFVNEGAGTLEEGLTHTIEDDDADEGYVFQVASWGAERGCFYLSANQGEEFRPLERVASGGELSRILLALKRVLAGAANVQTFVFDEIDSGVAGAAATQVAKKLRQIASTTDGGAQILCISHTPQIAAEADAHLHVQKHTVEGRTRTRVCILEHEQRVIEIARMLAGDQSMEQAIGLARELLQSSSTAPMPDWASSPERANP